MSDDDTQDLAETAMDRAEVTVKTEVTARYSIRMPADMVETAAEEREMPVRKLTEALAHNLAKRRFREEYGSHGFGNIAVQYDSPAQATVIIFK